MARSKRFYGDTLSMSTTAAHKAIPGGYTEIKHYSSSPYRLGLAPKLMAVFVYANSTTSYSDNYVSYSTDGSSSTHVPLDALGTSDIVYLGFSEMPRGVYIDVGANVNAEAATLDVEYYTGVAWADVAGDSDGTDSGGATLAQDGLYTWTVPTSASLSINNVHGLTWIRFKPSAALSATVDINEIIPACVDTNYGYFESGVEYQYAFDNSMVGAIETDMADGTATLNITWIRT